MMEDWEEIKLGDVVDIGSSKRIYAADYVENGIPFYRSKEVIETYRGREISLELFISEEKYNLIKEKYGVPQIGDILITSVGTIGVPLVIKQNESFYFKDGNLIWVKTSKVEDRLDPSYFYFFLDSAYGQAKLDSVLIGSSQKALTISGLNRLKINLPPIPIQHKIASILSAYDDLIENNLKRIVLLEEKAQLTYEEWFVRLKFPGHETMPINTETVLPEGWVKVKLSDIGEIVTGKTPSTSKEEYFNGDIPFIKTPNMSGFPYVMETSDYLTKKGADTQKKKYLPKNSLVVSCIGSAGKYALVAEDSQFNQQINAIKFSKEHYTFYTYCFAKYLKPLLDAIGSNGATMTNVNKSKFEKIEITKPDEELLKTFHSNVKLNFEAIYSLMKQNQYLKEARDILLPRLMGGIIDVEQLNLETLQSTKE